MFKDVIGPHMWFCSMEHMKKWQEWGSDMDWDSGEDKMLLDAGKAGGQFLESIQQTDLQHLSEEQWLNFLRAVVGRLSQIRPDEPTLNDEIPF